MIGECKRAAKATLVGKWNSIAILYLIAYVISAIATSIIGAVVVYVSFITLFLITIPLEVGTTRAAMAVFRSTEKVEAGMLLTGYKSFIRVLEVGVRKYVIIFLFSLLLVIPGIIMAYKYRFTTFILLDDQELSPKEVLKKSGALTDGHKFELFLLDLSFIGWYILSAFTLGILLIWVMPYLQISLCAMYHKLREMKFGEVGVYANEADFSGVQQSIEYKTEDNDKYEY